MKGFKYMINTEALKPMCLTPYQAVDFKTEGTAKTGAEGPHMSSASITLRANFVKMISLKLANAIQNQLGKRKASG